MKNKGLRALRDIEIVIRNATQSFDWCKMSFYRNSSGGVAKVLNSFNRVVVMTNYKTMFFDSMADANSYLLGLGFYKG